MVLYWTCSIFYVYIILLPFCFLTKEHALASSFPKISHRFLWKETIFLAGLISIDIEKAISKVNNLEN